MNDRFKFRVWNQKHNFYCNQLAEMCINYNGYCFDNGVRADYFEHDGFVIEQCTGLKDKNGNLIYEGDIVKCDRDFSENGRKNLIRKVIFADGSFQLERAKTIGDRYYINAFHNFEIIGNIHEQAEQKDK